jgi:ATP-dependent DNA helicase RecG
LTQKELEALLNELRALPSETEWVEFKLNNIEPQSIGEYISALSNSACLHQKDSAYLVFGVENVTHVVKGTKFRPKKEKIGNQEIENWLATQLSPPIDFKVFEFTYDGCPVIIIKIDPTYNTPVRFKSTEYIRVGSYKKKLADHPEKERKIWKRKENEDWSAQICKNASIDDLEPEAIMKARAEFEQKYPKFSEEIGSWDDITFLNKAKITIDDKITNTAILLLGRPESEHFISPSVSKITWVLKDDYMFDKDYEHFGTPFLLNTEPLFARIRNLKYRYIPDKLRRRDLIDHIIRKQYLLLSNGMER